MNTSNSRLYYKVAISSRERCNSGGLQQVVKDDTFCGNDRRYISRRFGKVIQEQCVEVAWIAGKCSIRQRAAVCSGVNKRVEQDVGNRNEVVNSISPTNGWADRTNEPRIGIVFKVPCKSQVEGLAGVAGISRICSEQQGSHSNKGFAFHGKLWQRVKNGWGYKEERKGGEENRICGKNEEGS